jgi:carbon monoxide dehydrogenase subunit G
MGNLTIRVIEREAPKCIKLEAVGSPIPVNIWIQIIPNGEEAAKMRVVIKAEVNFMLRSMIDKPLKEGVEKIAEALSLIAY